MSDDKSLYTCPVCNTQWLVSAYDQTWTCPKCKKTVENPDVKIPVIEKHALTTEQKIEKAVSYYRKALDKAFDKYDNNVDVGLEFNFSLYDIFDNTPEENDAIEDAIRKTAVNDRRLTINRISYSQSLNIVYCDFGLTDKGRAYYDRVAKERYWNSLSAGKKAAEAAGNAVEYGCGCLYIFPLVAGLLLFLLFVIAACAQMG